MKMIKDSTGKTKAPRGKHHNETESKKTVSLYLSKKLVEKARNHNVNLSSHRKCFKQYFKLFRTTKQTEQPFS